MPSSSGIFSLRRLCALLLSLFIVVSSPEDMSAQMIDFHSVEKGYQLLTDDGQPFAPLSAINSYARTSSLNRHLVKVSSLWGMIDGLGNMVVPPMYQDIMAIRGMKSCYAAKIQNYWFLMDDYGKLLSNEPFDNIITDYSFNDSTQKQYIIVRRDGLYGVVDPNGKEILPPSFSEYAALGYNKKVHQAVWLRKNGLWGMLKFPKQEILPFSFDSIDVSFTGVSYITYARCDGKWGIIDNPTGRVSYPFEYQDYSCEDFPDSASALKKDGKWGVISLLTTVNDKPIIPLISDEKPEISANGSFSRRNRLINICQNRKWSLVDFSGKLVIPQTFDDNVYCYTPDRYKTKLRGNAILINEKGEQLSPLGYSELRYVNDSLIETTRGQKGAEEYGLITTSGTVILEPRFTTIESYIGQNRAFVKQRSKYGFALCNIQTGEILTDFIYNYTDQRFFPSFDLFSTKGTVAVAASNGKIGIIDTLGREIQPPIFEKVRMMELLGSSLVKHPDGNWSFLTATGEFRQKERYSEVSSFTTFETLVKCNGKWGAINDSTGEEVIAPRYDSVRFPLSGFPKVLRDGKWFILNSATHKETTLEDIGRNYTRYAIESGCLAARKNGQWGAISRDPQDAERVIIPFQYDHLEIMSKEYARVRRGTKYGVIALSGGDKGKELVPLEYEILGGFDEGNRTFVGFKNGVEELIHLGGTSTK